MKKIIEEEKENKKPPEFYDRRKQCRLRNKKEQLGNKI